MQALSSGGVTTRDDMLLLCNLQHGSSLRPFYLLLYEKVLCGVSKHKPLIPLLELNKNYEGPCLEECLTQADLMHSSEVAELLLTTNLINFLLNFYSLGYNKCASCLVFGTHTKYISKSECACW